LGCFGDDCLSVNQLHFNSRDQIATLSLARRGEWTGDPIRILLPFLSFDKVRAMNGVALTEQSRTRDAVAVFATPSAMGRYIPPGQFLDPSAFYMVPRSSWSSFTVANPNKAKPIIHRPTFAQPMVLAQVDGPGANSLNMYAGGVDLRVYNTAIASDGNVNGGGGVLPLDGEFDCQLPADDQKADITLTLPRPFQRSRAWYLNPVYVAGGFVTTFRFRITNIGPLMGGFEQGGDGFAFVVQKAFKPLDEDAFPPRSGGYLGYDGLPNSLAVEFDTYQNREFFDLNGNHVSIHSRGPDFNTVSEHPSFGWPTATSGIPVLNDGREHLVEIRYEPPNLSVFLDDLANPILQVGWGITDVGDTYLGFTAATGSSFQQHDIIDWDIRSLRVRGG
jgi:hypothetical protein